MLGRFWINAIFIFLAMAFMFFLGMYVAKDIAHADGINVPETRAVSPAEKPNVGDFYEVHLV